MSKLTHIVAVLDGSGSMANLVSDVIGNLNNFVKEQKKLPGKATFTLIKFDDKYEVIFDSIPLKDVPTITQEHYFARNTTALNDAVCKSIKKFTLKRNVMFLIQTDGHENASREYTNKQVKEMVEHKTSKGWEFIFAGANIDAFAEGGMRGFAAKSTVNYDANARGVTNLYAAVSASAASYRTRS